MNRKGFTMLELLWVLVIIGFLTAMIAPRLGGVGRKGEETVDNLNLKQLKSQVKAYQTDHAHEFPDYPINLLLADDLATGANTIMATVEDVATERLESISYEFDERGLLSLHVLNANEANELRTLGIRRVLSWNHLNDPNYNPTNHARRYDPVEVAAGVKVLMVGGGAANTTSPITLRTDTSPGGTKGVQVNGRIGNPEWLFRAVLCIGEDSRLVEEGYIEHAPLCPSGLNNSRYMFNYYCLLMPRLPSTVGRIPPAIDDDDGDTIPDVDVADWDDPVNGKRRLINLGAQEYDEFDVTNATGHGYPEEVKWWRFEEL